MNNLIYLVPQGASLGRVCTGILKDLKTRGEFDLVYVKGIEGLTISGNPQRIIKAYQEKMNIGVLTRKGPYGHTVPFRFVKRTFRNMMNYKGSQAKLYKKIIVEPLGPVEGEIVHVKDLIKPLYYRKKINLVELLKKV